MIPKPLKQLSFLRRRNPLIKRRNPGKLRALIPNQSPKMSLKQSSETLFRRRKTLSPVLLHLSLRAVTRTLSLTKKVIRQNLYTSPSSRTTSPRAARRRNTFLLKKHPSSGMLVLYSLEMFLPKSSPAVCVTMPVCS